LTPEIEEVGMRVDEVMTREVVTVAPDTPLKAASSLFLTHRISGLPVVDDGRLVGVLSESDVVAKETSGYRNGDVSPAETQHLRREREAQTVAEAMTREPIAVEPWMSIWGAADLMAVHDVNRLPVVEANGTLVGIVTRDDLVRAFARSDRDVERDIREYLFPSVGLAPNDPLDVSVERGVVTVTGRIESEMARHCLRTTLHLVPGVVRVHWKVTATLPVA
jgi:CBS domain-containing protein